MRSSKSNAWQLRAAQPGHYGAAAAAAWHEAWSRMLATQTKAQGPGTPAMTQSPVRPQNIFGNLVQSYRSGCVAAGNTQHERSALRSALGAPFATLEELFNTRTFQHTVVAAASG
eukprot:365048-Chlamydomonas_euryale.AAC.27